MNSSQLLAVVVCALLALVYSAPAPESLKSDDLAQYAELAEQERLLEEALREQGFPLYEVEDVPQPMEKRAQTFVRFGKRSPLEKRAQTFVRFGKRAQTFVRFG